MIDWRASVDGELTQNQLTAIQIHTASELAISRINNGEYPDLLPNTRLELDVREDKSSVAAAIEAMIDFAQEGRTLIIGFPISEITVPCASVGTAYEIAQVSGTSSSTILSDEHQYPFYSRLTVSNDRYAESTKSSVLFYEEIQGRGWTEVAVIATISEFTTGLASDFINLAPPEITIGTYQQFLEDAESLDIELEQIILSGARVIYALIFGDWQTFIEKADAVGLVGETYVWYVPSTVVAFPFLEPSQETRGAIGNNFHTPDSPELTDFLAAWEAADPEQFPGAGPEYAAPSVLTYRVYDMILTVAKAIDMLEKSGQLQDDQAVPAQTWVDAVRSISFDGVSGPVSFESNGDRIGEYSLQYYSPEAGGWITSAIWTEERGYELIEDVVWYSNTTTIPDLDIREPFHYWSCEDKEMQFDSTGKSVDLHSPHGGAISNIGSDYYCDSFIDCKNLSDETTECATNYLIIFIVFGIIACLLILLSILLIIIVIIYGFILKYRKFRQCSPIFLVIVLLSVIVGYASIFAWFGKPHPVGCGFQPWLLGLSTISMISALSVKNFRIWQIFRNPSKKVRISDVKLLIMWCAFMAPAVCILVLWTIISTPTATLDNRDGKDHYVCATGGFTGPPGGIVFFSLFVGYGAIVLTFGALISIAIRNVHREFNETKLLAVSIYNLIFLAAVIIPVFLVVNPINPFAAWILRTVAILYAFGATTVVQFIPILFNVFILDKGKNVRQFKSKLDLHLNSTSPSVTSVTSE